MNRRRRIILTFAGVAMLVIFLWIIWPEDQGPSYQGLPLALALRTIDAVDASRPDFKVAVNAVQQIGTNGLPFLLKRINHEVPAWKTTLAGHIPRALFFKFPELVGPALSDAEATRADAAINAFAILREKATPAIPALITLLSEERPATSQRALSALACIGKNGLGELLRIATDVSYPESLRQAAIDAIGDFGTNADFVIPGLVEILNDSDPFPYNHAIVALGKLKIQPAVVVPVLANCLRSEDLLVASSAADALGKYGPEAAAAIPDILSARTNKNELVRIAVTNALRAMAPDAYKAPEH